MITLTNVTTFEIESCCKCSVQFAMPTELQRRRLDDHGSFYCPNGHAQHYTGKSEAERERERAEILERRLANAQENVRIARADETATRRKLSATKGQLTKTKNRIARGVCPCCNRSFENLQRHMAGQHPDYSKGEGQ